MHYTTLAAQYADDVLSGDIPACLYVRQACERFKRDIARSGDPAWGYYYDIEEAERWCRFLEKLPHVKGQWAKRNEKLVLSLWQVFITVNLFGWRRIGTLLRRFLEAYIECPRKQGKSFFIAGIGVGMLTIDDEHAAEVYSGATSEHQAWFVFGQALGIAKSSPALRKRFGVEANAKSVVIPTNASSFKPIIGKPGDGASPSCAIADEFHEHKDSDQVDTMVTGMGARDQPLMLYITTAGSDLGGPCYAKRADVLQILSGAVEDDAIFGIIYTLDEEDHWDTVEAQIKANPNYGVSVSPEFLKGQLAQARRSPTKQASYKTKYLNLWVGAMAAWMNMLAFQACRKRDLKIEDFKGRRCFIGLDLASKLDLCSLAVVFPPDGWPSVKDGQWAAFVKRYVPEERITEGGNTRYKAWHAEGWITATQGNVTDYSVIREDLEDLRDNFEIAEVAFDPFQATQFSGEMIEEGFEMVQYGMTVKNFSEPMKELEAKILKKKISFELDPMLMWCFSNVVARRDRKDNIFPNKEREEAKIDDVVALIMALARALVAKPTGTIYDTRGLTVA